MKKQSHQYLAVPCAGRENINNAPNHIYIIKDPDGKIIGEMTLNKAEETYDKEKVYVAASHLLCSKCYDDLMKK